MASAFAWQHSPDLRASQRGTCRRQIWPKSRALFSAVALHVKLL